MRMGPFFVALCGDVMQSVRDIGAENGINEVGRKTGETERAGEQASRKIFRSGARNGSVTTVMRAEGG
jgi:hypothetical protein